MRRRMKEALEQVEAVETLHEVPNLSRMRGASGLYRTGWATIASASRLRKKSSSSGVYTGATSTSIFRSEDVIERLRMQESRGSCTAIT